MKSNSYGARLNSYRLEIKSEITDLNILLYLFQLFVFEQIRPYICTNFFVVSCKLHELHMYIMLKVTNEIPMCEKPVFDAKIPSALEKILINQHTADNCTV